MLTCDRVIAGDSDGLHDEGGAEDGCVVAMDLAYGTTEMSGVSGHHLHAIPISKPASFRY